MGVDLVSVCHTCRSRQASVLARKRREYLDMVPEFYDIENDQRTEEEVGALRQVRRSTELPAWAANAAAATWRTACSTGEDSNRARWLRIVQQPRLVLLRVSW
jgi:hypothetical protein